MRSPFRYPGGKTWFVPYVRRWLKKFGGNVELIEPFAGGGIVSLTAAFENLARKIIMVEKDEDVAAVWLTILGQDAKWLAGQITDIKLSSENARTLLNHNPTSIRQKALATIIRNRLNHGGILADGAGLIKTGENGRGLMSRWYPETLKKRIMDIAEIKNKIEFVRGDGVDFIEKNLNRKNTVFFIDPPYTKTGKRLYKHHNINHRHLFDLAKNIKGDFLITYDDSQEIETLALDRNFQVERVLMKTTHHTQKYELIIGRELDWLRKMQEV